MSGSTISAALGLDDISSGSDASLEGNANSRLCPDEELIDFTKEIKLMDEEIEDLSGNTDFTVDAAG